MTSIRCRGVLFDLDGVLVDSTPAVARVWAGWAREHGFDPDEVVKRAHGRPSLATIRELLPNADHAEENREVERREIADVEGVLPLPGAKELLRALPPGRWAIVTSCTRALAHRAHRCGGTAKTQTSGHRDRCAPWQAGPRALSERRANTRHTGGGLPCSRGCSRGNSSRKSSGCVRPGLAHYRE
jgi:Haloacid dehalogenase-like hydrolase